MGSDIAITVEVTISDELRHLLAGASVGVVESVAPTAPPAAPSGDAIWQQILLRRDGQRPLSFRGLALVTRTCISDDPDGRAEQTLSLYLGEDKTLYAALAFVPPASAPARPTHRCQPIRDQDEFQAFLAAWQPERCFVTGPTHHQNPVAELLAARSAFNSMTADCLCKGVLQA